MRLSCAQPSSKHCTTSPTITRAFPLRRSNLERNLQFLLIDVSSIAIRPWSSTVSISSARRLVEQHGIADPLPDYRPRGLNDGSRPPGLVGSLRCSAGGMAYRTGPGTCFPIVPPMIMVSTVL
jgi:hypothetical protein